MATEAQILANRRNAQKSTGSRTAPRTNRLSSPACQPITTFFMQNKANLMGAQMNVNPVKTMNYEQITMNNDDKNKPNSNPIQTQYKPNRTQNKANQSQYKPNFRKARMDVSLAITRNYNNEQRTMNYELLFKTNPIKPNLVRHSLGEGGFKRGVYSLEGCKIAFQVV